MDEGFGRGTGKPPREDRLPSIGRPAPPPPDVVDPPPPPGSTKPSLLTRPGPTTTSGSPRPQDPAAGGSSGPVPADERPPEDPVEPPDPGFAPPDDDDDEAPPAVTPEQRAEAIALLELFGVEDADQLSDAELRDALTDAADAALRGRDSLDEPTPTDSALATAAAVAEGGGAFVVNGDGSITLINAAGEEFATIPPGAEGGDPRAAGLQALFGLPSTSPVPTNDTVERIREQEAAGGSAVVHVDGSVDLLDADGEVVETIPTDIASEIGQAVETFAEGLGTVDEQLEEAPATFAEEFEAALDQIRDAAETIAALGSGATTAEPAPEGTPPAEGDEDDEDEDDDEDDGEDDDDDEDDEGDEDGGEGAEADDAEGSVGTTVDPETVQPIGFSQEALDTSAADVVQADPDETDPDDGGDTGGVVGGTGDGGEDPGEQPGVDLPPEPEGGALVDSGRPIGTPTGGNTGGNVDPDDETGTAQGGGGGADDGGTTADDGLDGDGSVGAGSFAPGGGGLEIDPDEVLADVDRATGPRDLPEEPAAEPRPLLASDVASAVDSGPDLPDPVVADQGPTGNLFEEALLGPAPAPAGGVQVGFADGSVRVVDEGAGGRVPSVADGTSNTILAGESDAGAQVAFGDGSVRFVDAGAGGGRVPSVTDGTSNTVLASEEDDGFGDGLVRPVGGGGRVPSVTDGTSNTVLASEEDGGFGDGVVRPVGGGGRVPSVTDGTSNTVLASEEDDGFGDGVVRPVGGGGRVPSVTDGTSNTLLVGESEGGAQAGRGLGITRLPGRPAVEDDDVGRGRLPQPGRPAARPAAEDADRPAPAAPSDDGDDLDFGAGAPTAPPAAVEPPPEPPAGGEPAAGSADPPPPIEAPPAAEPEPDAEPVPDLPPELPELLPEPDPEPEPADPPPPADPAPDPDDPLG